MTSNKFESNGLIIVKAVGLFMLVLFLTLLAALSSE